VLFIGDVHDKIDEYRQIIANVSESIQVGDFSEVGYPIFAPGHKILLGNHDNYDCDTRNHPNVLGDYDVYKGIGYVRGAASIDQKKREIRGRYWSPKEELTYLQAMDCLYFFKRNKVDIMVSHDCPQFVFEEFANRDKSRTRQLLDQVHKIVKPKIWVFGHHHRHLQLLREGTMFYCLKELETLEL